MERNEVCIYHIGERFLYEYYYQPKDYCICIEDKVQILLDKALEEEKKGGLMGALQCYEKALDYNPVSTRVYFLMIDCYYRLGNTKAIYETAQKVYPFCATAAELAQYYRWLGFYYLETYKPELSQVLYRYSTYWEPSAQVESEIQYLEKALEKKMPEYSVSELQEKLDAENIPAAASSVTLALLYRAGEEAYKEASDGEHSEAARESLKQQAIDCYSMVYSLTGDEEINERINIICTTGF